MNKHIKILLSSLLFLAAPIITHAQNIGCDSCTTQAKGNTKIHKAITYDTLTATEAFKRYYGKDTSAMEYVDAATGDLMFMKNGVSSPLNGGGSTSLTATQIAFGSPTNTITSSDGLTYDTTGQSFNVEFEGNTFFSINAGTENGRKVELGDIDDAFNQTSISLIDFLNVIRFSGNRLASSSPAQPNVNFLGTGLNDMTNVTVAFTGFAPTLYTITIDGNDGTEDTYTWTDGTNTVNNVPITSDDQALSNGVFIIFNATTGHTIGDSWSFVFSVDVGSYAQFSPFNIGVGDIDNVNLGEHFTIREQDNNSSWQAVIRDAVATYLLINTGTQQYNLGNPSGAQINVDDADNNVTIVGGATNGISLIVDDGDQLMIYKTNNGQLNIDISELSAIRARVEPDKDGTYAMTNDLPVSGQITAASPGASTSFGVTIPTGHSTCVSISATPATIITTGCSISGTTLTITCATASIGGAPITLNYFYQ